MRGWSVFIVCVKLFVVYAEIVSRAQSYHKFILPSVMIKSATWCSAFRRVVGIFFCISKFVSVKHQRVQVWPNESIYSDEVVTYNFKNFRLHKILRSKIHIKYINSMLNGQKLPLVTIYLYLIYVQLTSTLNCCCGE